jgi:primosomal protein N''
MRSAMPLAKLLIVGLVLGGTLHADLQKAMAEPNLEKRSKLALENASAAYQSARADYEKGDAARLTADIQEIQDSVELAYTSLKDTGKDPRKHSKWFKRAEIETRDLLRRLDAFQRDMSFEDRPMLDKLKARVQKIHDDLLLGLMEGNPK